MRILVVLPTYNEAGNIARTLRMLLDHEAGVDVLVVDDSSPDGTAAIVLEWERAFPDRVRLHSRHTKDGLGSAYRAGFATALRGGYDAIVQMDADGSHPIEALVRMRSRLLAGDDLVIGSRYVVGGTVPSNWPRYRRLLSGTGNGYARALLRVPVRDLTGGFKMWRSTTLAGLRLDEADAAGYAFQVQTTLLALASGARVSEVPIAFAERVTGQSKMTARIVFEAARAVAALRPLARDARGRHQRLDPAVAGGVTVTTHFAERAA